MPHIVTAADTGSAENADKYTRVELMRKCYRRYRIDYTRS